MTDYARWKADRTRQHGRQLDAIERNRDTGPRIDVVAGYGARITVVCEQHEVRQDFTRYSEASNFLWTHEERFH